MENSKQFYQSKTFFGGVGMFALAIVLLLKPELLAHPNLDKALGIVGTAYMLWGIRTAEKPIK